MRIWTRRLAQSCYFGWFLGPRPGIYFFGLILFSYFNCFDDFDFFSSKYFNNMLNGFEAVGFKKNQRNIVEYIYICIFHLPNLYIKICFKGDRM